MQNKTQYNHMRKKLQELSVPDSAGLLRAAMEKLIAEKS
jgi:hypothetical protein